MTDLVDLDLGRYLDQRHLQNLREDAIQSEHDWLLQKASDAQLGAALRDAARQSSAIDEALFALLYDVAVHRVDEGDDA